MLVILMAYDQLCGEVQFRTIRYMTIRSHRASLIVGKALGMWLVAGVISLIVALITWIATIAIGGVSVGNVFSYGFHFWAVTAAFSLAYVGLTTLVSSISRTPTVAAMTTLGIAFGIWILKKYTAMDSCPGAIKWLHQIIPGSWEEKLLSPRVQDFGVGMLVCLAFGAVCVALSALWLRRKDI